MRIYTAILSLFAITMMVLTGYTQSETVTETAKLRAKELQRIDSLIVLAGKLVRSRKYSAAEDMSNVILQLSQQEEYPEGQADVYLTLSYIAYVNRDFVKSEEQGKHALEVAQKAALQLPLAKAYIRWGSAVWAQSRFVEATNAFQQARQLYTSLQDSSGIGISNSLLALAEEERGNYEKSFQYSMDALPYDEQRAFISIGQLYAHVGDYDAALEYYRKVKDEDLSISNYLKVGEAHFLKRNYDSAIYYYTQFIASNAGIGYKINSKPYVLIGEVFLAESRSDSALYYLNNGLDGLREVNDRNWIMRGLLALGKAYKQTQQLPRALDHTRELLMVATKSGALQYERDAHYLLFEIFDGLHNTDSAYRHLNAYTTLNKAIDIDVSARKLGFFRASGQLEQAKLEIDLLNRQRQLQQEEIAQAAKEKWLMLFGVVILVVAFAILVRNFALKKRNAEHLQQLSANELQIEKLEHTKKLGELEMQVLRVQMNPHFIFNSLNSINRFILRNNKTEATAYLTKLSRLVRMILQNSQSTFISLESEIQSLTLYLDLEKLRFDNQFTYKIELDKNVDASLAKVPPLIMQPFVENAIWHGLMPKNTLGEINIRVSVDERYLFISISDDGVGRAASESRKGMQAATHRSLGLSITSQRINMMHDGMEVNTVNIKDLVDAHGAPAGTEVEIKLPLRYA
ncbi:histidine kinase [Chryseolinea sp. T2]|uniref:tetratricopeptide repeat-containing sensor histidine kinase n=1 Tax=Chryseolinea sp. T2 TaxID=3129255 RepID=UPI003076C6F7